MSILDPEKRLNQGAFHALSAVQTEATQAPYEAKFKSAHTVLAGEIWADPVPVAATLADALAAEGPVVQHLAFGVGILTPIPGTNGQAWRLLTNTGTPIRNWISPRDVPDPATGEPSLGYTLRLRDTVGDRGATEGRWDVDYYAGIILFEEGYTPADLGWSGVQASVFLYVGTLGAGAAAPANQNSLVPGSSTIAPTVDAVVYALGEKASIYSPQFFGFPTAPYPSPSPTTAEGLATQGYVLDKIRGLVTIAISGNNTIYSNYDEAEAELENDPAAPLPLVTLYGYHPNVTIDKNVRLSGGTVGTMVIGYGDNNAEMRVVVEDMTLTGRTVVCAPYYITNGAYYVTFDNVRMGPNAFFEQYDLGTDSTCSTKVTVRNVTMTNEDPYSTALGNGQRGTGCLRFQERPDQAVAQWYLENCVFNSRFGNAISGYHGQQAKVFLRSTKLVPAPGKLPFEGSTLNSGVATPYDQFIFDITTRALAALKTGTVVSFREPSEYTPLLNGTFTVDTLEAVVGNDVSVYLGPNCTEPNLPATFERLGAEVFTPGGWQMYTFKLAPTGKFYYYITPVQSWA